ncbi:thiamine pyrophosphate-dependent enzyme [Bradyrhizobium cenepequi]
MNIETQRSLYMLPCASNQGARFPRCTPRAAWTHPDEIITEISEFLTGAARRSVVGESCPVAVGVAYSVMLRNLPEAVICFFGDGAVNQGTFHESLNMAGLFRAPIVPPSSSRRRHHDGWRSRLDVCVRGL